jgi:acyl-coenzyme A synthetase/AMP-(fatty) acid ligase
MHPAEMIFYWAKTNPENLAAVQPDMAITYRALASAIAAVGKRIERYGFDQSEPVAVAIDDPTRFLTVCLALLSKGFACAPVNREMFPHLQSNNIGNLIFAGEANVIAGGRNVRFDDGWLQSETNAAPVWRPEQTALAAAADMIFFTSGTTGTPKKVVIPSRALPHRTKLLSFSGETDFTRALVIPSVSSNFGFVKVAMQMFAGKTVFFAGDTGDPLRLINTFKIEMISASAQQALSLVELIETEPGHRMDSVKEVRIGGGFASLDLVRRIQARLCRNVTTEYGATESSLVAVANYATTADIPNAVGIVLPGIDIEIVDETNTPVPPGEEGLVRGRSSFISEMFAANNPAKAAEAADAWWYPGDLGRLMPNGVLCIGGRMDDVINCGGVKVSAVALDEIVCRYPGIKDAGVCGVRSASGLEEAWVGIVADPGIDTADLKHSLEQSQKYQVRVGEILVIEKVPRNNLGKLQRHDLRAMLLGMKSRALTEATTK